MHVKDTAMTGANLSVRSPVKHILCSITEDEW